METIKEIAQWVWMDCKNRHRLYPDNNHTFADWWATAAPTFEKFTLLKETPTIATDNTLPPSSPTATAEENPGSLKEFRKHFSKLVDQEMMTQLLIKHDSRPLKLHFAEDDVYRAMTEYSSLKEQEAHNRAVQECEKVIGVIKHGLQQMIDEAPNMLSPDGRFGQRAEDRNHGMQQAAKLALTMVKMIEEKELEKLKK